MNKAEPGEYYGCTDGGSPITTEYDLSRVYDMLYHAELVGGQNLTRQVFTLLPDSVKLDFNYSKWQYEAL